VPFGYLDCFERLEVLYSDYFKVGVRSVLVAFDEERRRGELVGAYNVSERRKLKDIVKTQCYC
jgi:hypothetical protein